MYACVHTYKEVVHSHNVRTWCDGRQQSSAVKYNNMHACTRVHAHTHTHTRTHTHAHAHTHTHTHYTSTDVIPFVTSMMY